MTDTTAQSPIVPSPDQPVPDEFDLVCEHCGYSLVGLTSDRCPECGEWFDTKALPLARVPWLFRRRLGRISSYRQTVVEILRAPARFAREVCRPVRICISDARAFRKMSVRLAVASIVIAALLYVALTIPWVAYLSPRTLSGQRDMMVLAIAVVLTPWVVALLNLFFLLGTDLPTFIWKGLEDNPIDLAPLHHYASAPLALAAMLILPAGLSAGLNQIAPDTIFAIAAAALLILCAVVIVALLWWIPLRLMKTATGCGPRRVLMLALYLPLHWFVMLTLCTLLFVVGAMFIGKMIEWIWPF
jgi:hypothetical protein